MEQAPKVEGALSGTSALDDGLGIWRRPRPPMYHLCTLDIHQTDKPLNVGVWEIIGFEEMDTPQEVFILRRFSPSEPSGQTGEQFKFWRRMYELGHMHVWRRGPDLLDPRFLMSPVTGRPPAEGGESDELGERDGR